MPCNDACVYQEYDGSTSFSTERMPRAAKPHQCSECNDVIAKGDVHHYASGKTDGQFWDMRTCAACHEIRKTFCCDGWVGGMLWEDIHDQLFSRWDFRTSID